MGIKLFDSELKLMALLWAHGALSAKALSELCAAQTGWSKTTTYTVIKKCIDKGAIERRDPGFICRALVSREEAQQSETDELIDKLYDGSVDLLVASLLSRDRLSAEQIEKLRGIVNGHRQ